MTDDEHYIEGLSEINYDLGDGYNNYVNATRQSFAKLIPYLSTASMLKAVVPFAAGLKKGYCDAKGIDHAVDEVLAAGIFSCLCSSAIKGYEYGVRSLQDGVDCSEASRTAIANGAAGGLIYGVLCAYLLAASGYALGTIAGREL